MINKISEHLVQHIATEFDKLKDKRVLTYEKDFEAFSLGYTMGVLGTIHTMNTRKKVNQ